MMMKAGLAAAKALRAAGVKDIFGLMGSSVLELYDSLYDFKDIRYVGVRHENCGMHMADAYARIAGRPSLFIAGQAGPGAANMVLGLAQAKLACSPVVALTGMPSTEHLGRDGFQEIDQSTLFIPVTKRVLTVPRSDRIPEMLLEAFRIADSGRRGPVLVQVPRDMFNDRIDVEVPDSIATRHHEGGIPAAAVQQAARLLQTAQKPVIVAGAGIKWGQGRAHLLRLAEQLQIPIIASSGHSDVAPTSHPMFYGQAGARGNPVTNAMLLDADLILAMGTRLGFSTTFFKYQFLSPNARIIQVDIDPVAVGRHFPVALGVVGDAGELCQGLAEVMPAPATIPWQARNQRFRQEREQLLQQREQAGMSADTPLHHQVVYKELRDAAPPDTIFTLDTGSACGQASDQLRYTETPSLVTSLDWAACGVSYAFGLGAKVARPDRCVVSLSGDGAFGMTVGEMSTAIQCGIGTIAVVLDNGAWGSEFAYQRDYYEDRFIGAHCHSPRFDEVAKLYGADGYYVTERGQLADAVSQAVKTGNPTVIHVKVTLDDVRGLRTDAVKHRAMV